MDKLVKRTFKKLPLKEGETQTYEMTTVLENTVVITKEQLEEQLSYHETQKEQMLTGIGNLKNILTEINKL